MCGPLRALPAQDLLKEFFNYDPETGVFTRAKDRRKWKAGSVVGTPSQDGYINIGFGYKIYRAHRIAWRYMTGDDPKTGIDHINGNRSDNRFCNLRLATQSENLCNQPKRKAIKSGMKGVYGGKNGKFYSKIMLRGKSTHLGTFDTKEEAQAAYNAASKVIHGSFGRPS